MSSWPIWRRRPRALAGTIARQQLEPNVLLAPQFTMSVNSAVSIVSSAPTRIDLAGGTIDIWPLYLFHDGASTLNAAISLRAHARIEPRTDGRIELRSVDTDRRSHAPPHWTELSGSGDCRSCSRCSRGTIGWRTRR